MTWTTISNAFPRRVHCSVSCPVVGMMVFEQSSRRTGDSFTWTGERLFRSVTCMVLQEQPESTWNLSRLKDDGLT